jgi:hypothetical protein
LASPEGLTPARSRDSTPGWFGAFRIVSCIVLLKVSSGFEARTEEVALHL